MDARAANSRIAEKAERLQFLSRVPMLCECSAPECRAIVMISLDEYDQVRSDPDSFLIALGHDLQGTELTAETPSYAVRRRTRGRDEGNGDRRSA